MNDIFAFDTSRLVAHIKEHHSIYDFPVKDTSAENILVSFLEANGCRVGWKAGSHKPGSDVFAYLNKRSGYSVKSGKKRMRGKWFKISSYRTGSDDAVKDKKTAIRKIEDEITSYVVFARQESKVRKQHLVNVIYCVYVIDPSLLSIDNFNINNEPDAKGNFTGVSDLGVNIFIKQKMSAQVWYSVPMAIVNEGNLVKKLCEVGPLPMKLRPCDVNYDKM